MDSETNDKIEMAETGLELLETVEPLLEIAEGFRAKMESRGWSSTSAETAASTMLNALLLNAMTQGLQK